MNESLLLVILVFIGVWLYLIDRKLNRDTHRERLFMSAIDNLTAAVTQTVALSQQAIALLGQLSSTSNEPALTSLASQLTDSNSALSAALQANTPPTP